MTLIWVKRVWRCRHDRCTVSTWSETSAAIGARASLTERARAQAARRVGRDGESVTAVAREFGVGWGTIMAAVRDHGQPLIDDPTRLAGVNALGVDETAFTAATPAARPSLSPGSWTSPAAGSSMAAAGWRGCSTWSRAARPGR